MRARAESAACNPHHRPPSLMVMAEGSREPGELLPCHKGSCSEGGRKQSITGNASSGGPGGDGVSQVSLQCLAKGFTRAPANQVPKGYGNISSAFFC